MEVIDKGKKEKKSLAIHTNANQDQDRSGSIRVAICDACPTIRHGLEHILESVPDITVVVQASSQDELLRQIADLDIDVVLIDIDDHAYDVYGYVHSFREKMPSSRILVFTNCEDRVQVVKTLAHGVEGFQCKRNADAGDVVRAIRTLQLGGRDLAPCVTEALLSQVKADQQMDQVQLSAREQQVLDLIAQGKTNSAIADSLYISIRTVKFHVSAILSKLNVKNRTEAALWLL